MRVFVLSFLIGLVVVFNFGFGKSCGITSDEVQGSIFKEVDDDDTIAAQSVDPDEERLRGGSSVQTASGPCPSDMALVETEYCPQLTETCLKWIGGPVCMLSGRDKKGKPYCKHMGPPMRCAEWKYPTECKTPAAKRPHIKVCVNKHEGANVVGQKPEAGLTFYDAEKRCADQGKRLCTDKEWQSACRGIDNRPYSTGYVRPVEGQCNIDTTLPWLDPATHTKEELAEAFLASGSNPECKTKEGVYDLTGNYDEWVRSTTQTPYTSVLFSGHPFKVRNRCTTKTTSHSEGSSYYDISYRCCKDPE